MTAQSTQSLTATAATPADSDHPIARPSRWDWPWWIATVIAVLALSLPLLHPWWTPQSDSDAYLAVARQIATGRGYQYNRQPITVIPPGWPLVLAGAMHLTSSLLLLKLMLIGLLTASAAVAWRALRLLAAPAGTATGSPAAAPIASAAVVAAYLVPEVILQGTVFHAEALFCLLFWAAMLLAVQVNRRTDPRGRWTLLAGLAAACAAMVAVRWAAMLTCPVIAAAAVAGEGRPRRNARWLAAVIAIGVTVLTAVPLRLATRLDDPALADAGNPGHLMYAQARVNSDTPLAERVAAGGRWIGELLWPTDGLWPAVTAPAGWAALGLIVLWAAMAARKHNWLPTAAAAYVLFLLVAWPHPVPRYLVPIAPLIVLGLIEMAQLLRSAGRSGRAIAAAAAIALVAWIAVHNVPPYLRQARLARSTNYYAAIDAGRFDDLVDAGRYLLSMRLGSGEVAINRWEPADDGVAPRTTNRYLRALILLADVPVRTVPDRWAGEPSADFFRWAHSQGIRYYLYQPPRTRMRQGQLVRTRHRWVLYEIRPTRGVPVVLDDVPAWPRRLPHRPPSRRGPPAVVK